MSFTDDDLAIAKRQHQHTSSKTECKTCALLTRLDAAENVIHAYIRLEKEEVSYDYFVTLLNQWRKKAGE